jgi:hypothetical protein
MMFNDWRYRGGPDQPAGAPIPSGAIALAARWRRPDCSCASARAAFAAGGRFGISARVVSPA